MIYQTNDLPDSGLHDHENKADGFPRPSKRWSYGFFGAFAETQT
jgi:hypothetical protein